LKGIKGEMIWLMQFRCVYGLVYAIFRGIFYLSMIDKKCLFNNSVMCYCYENE